jgi:hypothetical protein
VHTQSACPYGGVLSWKISWLPTLVAIANSSIGQGRTEVRAKPCNPRGIAYRGQSRAFRIIELQIGVILTIDFVLATNAGSPILRQLSPRP